MRNINNIVCLLGLALLSSWTGLSDSCASDDFDSVYASAEKAFDDGDYTTAKKMYADAIALKPDYAPSYNNLALALSKDESTINQAINNFIKAIKTDNFYADPYANLGVICFKLGQYDRAEKYLSRAIQLDPGNAAYTFSLAWVYTSGLNKTDAAISLLQKTLELDPDYADAYYVLGLAYAAKGNMPMVFDQVTALRIHRKDGLANALENIIRTPSLSGQTAMNNSGVNVDYGIRQSQPPEKPLSAQISVKSSSKGRGQLQSLSGKDVQKSTGKLVGTPSESKGKAKLKSKTMEIKLHVKSAEVKQNAQ